MIPNRSRWVAFLVVVAVVVAAGIGVATYIRKDKTPAFGRQVTPPVETEGTSDTAGQEQKVVENCLDVKPEPVRYKFNDKNFPTGKLGEWYEVKNEQGQTIMKVKVVNANRKVTHLGPLC